MAPVTALLFRHRLPTLTTTQFRDYMEDTHVPLVKSLLSPKHPLTHTRYYTNKDSGHVIGSPSPTDVDLIAVITFESEEAMQQSLQARQADGTREIIEADESKFLDRSKVQFVALGGVDVRTSAREE
ncbi:uncharacterized protein Z519_04144 [Cladophialophora bantiana CBS 173.52]|uniref:EthD domain-containing protein n=1 Tax=Cladophialophora bantiana (strain ATCC 10958 / CBS 173.52 / CDC B-1940 / NIH 8579) TaxID=1442370 RepID=A0A0D2IFM0_CLAB1|nr:uncharacterized protein Z519_04144 [Cladophialophora bantiana CBS 173.52]KIW95559.1 hypothetical protein Z519_04144 [Cladophialophora bantiana CBS 173.52]